MKTFLSVVIPSYNEQKNLERGVLDEVLTYLKKQNYDWELLLSDDGILKRWALQVSSLPLVIFYFARQ